MKITAILLEKMPGTSWEITEEDYNTLIFEDINLKPSLEQLIEWHEGMKLLEYREDRRKAYPSIEDQLDIIYHKGVNAWKAVIKITKDKYPKPE